jgi:hypothetical protein
MNVNNLLKALDDTTNDHLLNFTTESIRQMTWNILTELELSKKETTDIYNKLKDYKYIDEMSDLKYGMFLRWIPIEDPENIYLTKGSLFCEMKIKDEGVFCVCKNFGFPARHFQIAMDKNLIFQKLTEPELVLLSALSHLSENN